ncbi:hypothetical protein NicSoilC12_28510 [Arthrobacter sp. NicSoilC12]|nr:hypothetical protein NicSoilC12_28510 [Arthrobacter sp. NicSoilC12]
MIAAVMLAATLPQAAVAAVEVPAAGQVSAGALAPAAAMQTGAVPAVSDPSPQGQVDDFVRPEPPAGRAKSEYTYVSAPLAGTLKTTLVTVQLADKTAAETDAAVPMAAAKASLSAANRYWAYATAGRVDIALASSRQLHKSAATLQAVAGADRGHRLPGAGLDAEFLHGAGHVHPRRLPHQRRRGNDLQQRQHWRPHPDAAEQPALHAGPGT